MKKLFLIFILVVSLIAGNANTVLALKDTIIAVVNDDVITLQELQDYLSAVYVELSSSGKSEEEVRQLMSTYQKDSLRKLIEKKLLVDEADNKELTVSDRAIEARLEEIKAHYGSDEVFISRLSSDGLTITDIRNTITGQLKSKAIIDHEVQSKVFVNPQEITDYYQKHKDEFLKPEKVSLESIFIPYGDAANKAHEKANKIINILNQPNSDFKAISDEYSQGPSIGIIEKGQFLPDIEKVVFALKKDALSKPIKTESGIYILKVTDKYALEQIPLEEASNKIYKILFREKFEKRMTAWLKKLKTQAYIEIKG